MKYRLPDEKNYPRILIPLVLVDPIPRRRTYEGYLRFLFSSTETLRQRTAALIPLHTLPETVKKTKDQLRPSDFEELAKALRQPPLTIVVPYELDFDSLYSVLQHLDGTLATELTVKEGQFCSFCLLHSNKRFALMSLGCQRTTSKTHAQENEETAKETASKADDARNPKTDEVEGESDMEEEEEKATGGGSGRREKRPDQSVETGGWHPEKEPGSKVDVHTRLCNRFGYTVLLTELGVPNGDATLHGHIFFPSQFYCIDPRI